MLLSPEDRLEESFLSVELSDQKIGLCDKTSSSRASTITLKQKTALKCGRSTTVSITSHADFTA